MRLMLAALCASSLAACGTAPPAPEPVVRVVETRVEVPVRCIKVAPVRPALKEEDDILAAGNYDGGFILWAEWDVQRLYIKKLEALLPPCLADPA